jgi:hypothetical protein
MPTSGWSCTGGLARGGDAARSSSSSRVRVLTEVGVPVCGVLTDGGGGGAAGGAAGGGAAGGVGVGAGGGSVSTGAGAGRGAGFGWATG